MTSAPECFRGCYSPRGLISCIVYDPANDDCKNCPCRDNLKFIEPKDKRFCKISKREICQDVIIKEVTIECQGFDTFMKLKKEVKDL